MAARDVRLPASFKPTHETAGLPGFPATDVFGSPGEPVLAPEAGTLVDVHMIPWDLGKRVGGITAYLQGADGNTYFLTHLGGKVVAGPVTAGQPIGQIAAVPQGWWQSHVHEGLHQGLYQPGGTGQTAVTAAAPTAAPRAAPAPATAPAAPAAAAAPVLVSVPPAARTPTVDPALIALLLQSAGQPAAAAPAALEQPAAPPVRAAPAAPDFFTPLAQSQARTLQTGQFQLRPQPALPNQLRRP